MPPLRSPAPARPTSTATFYLFRNSGERPAGHERRERQRLPCGRSRRIFEQVEGAIADAIEDVSGTREDGLALARHAHVTCEWDVVERLGEFAEVAAVELAAVAEVGF